MTTSVVHFRTLVPIQLMGPRRTSAARCARCRIPSSSTSRTTLTKRLPWQNYFALLRSGALDVTLSSDVGRAVDGVRYFHLIGLVGRFWAAMSRYSVFVRDRDIRGPFEVTLALRDTKGAVLGGVAQGWRDGFEARHLPRCVEPHVLLRDEVGEWPVDNEQALAFRFGTWIEDAWGMKERRFIAREGEFQGRFDPRPYR